MIKRIESLSNDRNERLIRSFVDFMKSEDISQKYQEDNLFAILLYTKYLGDKELSGVDRKQDIIEFLDTRKKDTTIDPDGSLDKEDTSHDDLFDGFRLSMMFWH